MRFVGTTLCLLLVCTTSSAFGEENYPFPQLQTEVYCKASVAKMLNPNEQATELNKCRAQEAIFKIRLEPWWTFVAPKTQKMIVTRHYDEPEHQTYATLYQYIAMSVGEACLFGKIPCENPKAP